MVRRGGSEAIGRVDGPVRGREGAACGARCARVFGVPDGAVRRRVGSSPVSRCSGELCSSKGERLSGSHGPTRARTRSGLRAPPGRVLWRAAGNFGLPVLLSSVSHRAVVLEAFSEPP